MKRLVSIFALSLCLVQGSLFAAVDYLRDVKPVLKARCYACHGALKQKAGLRVDTVAFLLEGARSGDVLVPGNEGAGTLLDRISSDDLDERMPPEGEALSGEEIGWIREWIRGGAQAPESESPELDPADHWAFQMPLRKPIPGRSGTGEGNSSGGRNPIDAFIAAAHEEHGLEALPSIAPELLVRRLYLDLIGLPPTHDERQQFVANFALGSVERLVETLLATPQYGERWGRHWMDVWRYSDWYGLGAQLRNSQKHLWHWRDWIVDSLNQDKGYDRMIQEMLAGDELAPTDQATLRATGFLARNYYLFNRNTWLEQTIEHTGQAFLGLTLQCAKCHDHKYDPITQKEYYQFRAFFEPHQIRLDPVPGVTDLEKDGLPRAFDAHPEVATFLFKRGNEKEPDESHPLPAGVPKILEWEPIVYESLALPSEAFFPGLQAFVLEDRLRDADREIAEIKRRLKESGDVLETEATRSKLRALERLPAALRAVHHADRIRHGLEEGHDLDRATKEAALADQSYRVALAESKITALKSEVSKAEGKDKEEEKLKQAENALESLKQMFAKEPLNYVSIRPALKALESPAETDESRRKPFSHSTSGRRASLAKWITDRRNPLTARVAVNHIWMRHFGEPLVEDVTDFGRRSEEPPMQALLDYLAIYLMDHQWRMKPLHRLIVTSEAYQRESSTLAASKLSLERDPKNTYLWRRIPIRMESQVVRDSMRHLADELDLRVGGPTIDPAKGENLGRRSLYFTHSRDQQHSFLAMFDDAEILACYRRTESIIPQQALALVNSRLSMELADLVAKKLSEEEGLVSDEAFVYRGFERVLGAPPTEEEEALSLSMMADTRRSISEQVSGDVLTSRVRRNFVQALFNHNDFITIR